MEQAIKQLNVTRLMSADVGFPAICDHLELSWNRIFLYKFHLYMNENVLWVQCQMYKTGHQVMRNWHVS